MLKRQVSGRRPCVFDLGEGVQCGKIGELRGGVKYFCGKHGNKLSTYRDENGVFCPHQRNQAGKVCKKQKGWKTQQEE